jgi:UDP-glucose:tetrahydrobiopterin glucosyltransferase
MRIALIAPLVTPIAPPFLGGAQALLHDLAVTLAQRGHEVTLFAARGSRVEPPVRVCDLGIEATAAQLARVGRNTIAVPDASFYRQGEDFLRIFAALQREHGRYDVVHAHAFDWPAYAFGALAGLPLLHTLHMPATPSPISDLLHTIHTEEATSHRPYRGQEPAPTEEGGPGGKSTTWLATVSHACAATWAPYTLIDVVIYNGIRVADIPFQAAGENFLLFAGRIAPEKGLEYAIAIAQRTQLPLAIAGNIYDHAYYARYVQPALDCAGGAIQYLGHLDHADLYQLMGRARALLCPVVWEEPFGLVAVEAMAAGTPVVAFARGAMPEVIEDGVTGYLVSPDDIGAAAAAVARVGTLNRAACRRRVAQEFSLERMVAGYEAIYARMLR